MALRRSHGAACDFSGSFGSSGFAAAGSGVFATGAGTGVASPVGTASPSSTSTAIGSLTFTPAVPSGTRILPSTPSSTASTSMVALSVSISAITSPARTASPSFFNHRASVPSVMVGDSAGIRMLVAIGYAPLPGTILRTASATQSGCGNASFSRFAAYGSGTSSPATRTGGASSQSKQCSIACIAISAPMPA